MITQSLFKLGFSCRINTFSNNNGLFIKYNSLGIRRNNSTVLLLWQLYRNILCQFYHGPDMIWGSTAAAAGYHSTHFYNFFHNSSKIFWIYVINRFSIFTSWKSCIWVYQYRCRGNFQDICQNIFHLLRAKAAVDPQYIYSKTF